MPMDRSQLEQVINAGRSSALNCLDIGNKIPASDPIGKMFRSEALNRSLIFKVMEQITSLQHTISIVQTLIYFPFNLGNIYEGGDSILFDDPSFHRMMQAKTALNTRSRQGQIDYVMDLELIEMIHYLPALDPFLFKSKAEQLDLVGRIHPNYFNIDQKEWEVVRAPIRKKILQLIRSAFGSNADSDRSDEKMDVLAEKFLDKIWEAKDVGGIEDFVKAMNIAPEKAPELFFAWKAVCFYQAQFQKMEPELKALFSWVGDNTLSRPSDMMSLPRGERDRVEHDLAELRARMRHSYQKVVTILQTYEESYRHFVENRQPEPFKTFLASADDHYQEIAACLSAATHAAKVWRETTKRYGERISFVRYDGLLSTLCILFDAKVHVSETRAAS